MIEVSTLLMESEFVDEASAGLNRLLTYSGAAVPVVWDFKPVPVHRGRFGQTIVHNDADSVTLIYLDGGPGSTTVKAPQIEHFARHDLLFHRFRDEMEDLNTVIHREWQVGDVGSLRGRVESGPGGVIVRFTDIQRTGPGALLGNEVWDAYDTGG